MRGTLTQRSKGSWTLTFDTGRDITGKRQRQTVTIRGTKRQAEARMADLIHQVDGGGYVKPGSSTVGAYLQQWLEDYAHTHVRATTLEGYRARAKHLISGLGGIRLSELRPDHLQAYYSAKLQNGRRDGQGLAPATVIKHHNLLREALSHAVKWGLLARNVADAVDPPRGQRKEMQALTSTNLHRVLNACEGTAWHPIFHTLAWTGLRRSELLGLRWKDVDLLLATLRVSQVLHQLNDGRFVYQEPKTAKGRRTIALSPSSCIELRQHRGSQERDANLLGTPLTDDSLVFGHPGGSPRSPSTLTLAFRRLTRRLGFTGVRLHDLRHTHATLMMEQGVNPKVVSERLGHASVVITLDTYSHVLPNMQEDAVARFESAMAVAEGIA